MNSNGTNWPINNARQEPLCRYHDELMGRRVFPDVGHDFFIPGDVLDRVDHGLKFGRCQHGRQRSSVDAC